MRWLLADATARAMRAVEAIADGDTTFASEILNDLVTDLSVVSASLGERDA